MINKYSTLICLVFIFSACVANKTQINTYNINSEYEVKQKSNVSLINRIRSNPGIYVEGYGDNAKVFMKGVSSINFPKEILFVLDGIQVGNYSKISSILDPLKIKNIKILKNPIDLSMYGFMGSGGVIEIKTM
ncbi:MAG: hypothetical protein CMB81_04295 [Flammeovirgaceae bacterium]|jgi:outer membrane receptor for ferrienterochelin and colicin|nr:hypothetical protein [Flammeovirgaceae bacterium]|tara:strand:+ start:2177 stop:2575 length:399 start_codon:yes stop_codon:yes gene_type:complete